ncbi:MAG: hypothetical protein ACI9Y7_002230, partial [Dokdonia sp.]
MDYFFLISYLHDMKAIPVWKTNNQSQLSLLP